MGAFAGILRGFTVRCRAGLLFFTAALCLGITLEFLADARDARRTFALRIAD